MAESIDLSEQREYMAVYSVVFGAHGKVRVTSTEGGGVLQPWDMLETIRKKGETTAN